MPSEEIAAILGTSDPVLVHRYFVLHVEWLGERLADQRRTLAEIERLLAARAIAARRRAARRRKEEMAEV